MEALYNQVNLVARLKLSEMIKTVSQWYSWQTNKKKVFDINEFVTKKKTANIVIKLKDWYLLYAKCFYYIYKNLSICNARKTNVQKEVGHIIFHSLLEDNATRKLLGIDKYSWTKKFKRT